MQAVFRVRELFGYFKTTYAYLANHKLVCMPKLWTLASQTEAAGASFPFGETHSKLIEPYHVRTFRRVRAKRPNYA